MSDQRRHDLDALRAAAMLLGLVLHASLAYVNIKFWPVLDVYSHPIFDGLLHFIHGFRMPLFFVLSGFFAAMTFRKKRS